MESINIPGGFSVDVKPGSVTASTAGKSLSISFNDRVLKAKVENKDAITLAILGKATKRKVAAMRSVAAHIRNAFAGLTGGFSKQLQVVYSHFPVSIEVKGSEATIKNFLGEKQARRAKIIGDTKVEVKGQDISLTGYDKYSLGQTANNLMAATKIRQKDRRVFQDGIYPVS